MAGVSAQGATFTFGTHLTAFVTGISVETPAAEVVDMTGATHAIGQAVLVPTGDWSGGTVSVDYIHRVDQGSFDPFSVIRKTGPLTFSSAGYSVSRLAILTSASTDGRVGDIVRGNLKFQLTDYTGS